MEFVSDDVEVVAMLGDRGETVLDRPCFHVMPKTGWMNDPNGPIFHNGRYHMFYQQVTSGVTWDYGIVWGHASSPDLIKWEHHAPALVPSEGGPDANGCFSGCCVMDPATGLPTILYTGVRLRSNEECGPLPPPECDLQLEFIESQCIAVPDIGDEKLTTWHKAGVPIIPHPPAGLPLTGWRDPFIFEQGGPNKEWSMLIGSGIRGVGGTALIYKSHSLATGWRFSGMLCMGNESDTGRVWECPLLLPLNPAPLSKGGVFRSTLTRTTSGSHRRLFGHEFEWSPDTTAEPSLSQICGSVETGSGLKDMGVVALGEDNTNTNTNANNIEGNVVDGSAKHFFCVSPDSPDNPSLFWIGEFENGQFVMEDAEGPFKLDLGDVLYAPNVTADSQGRHLLWGWLQERVRMGEFDYAGCLSVPRVLYIRDGKLLQEPAEEIANLRKPQMWHELGLHIFAEEATPLQVVGGQCLDIEVTIERGSSTVAGMLFRSWNEDSSGSAGLFFNWDENFLEIVRGTLSHDLRIYSDDKTGGIIDMKPGDPLELRILLDHSCLEIFTGTGEVLSTRVYRGVGGCTVRQSDSGIDFVAYGGSAKLARVMAFEMSSIWECETGIGNGSGSDDSSNAGSCGEAAPIL